ncbi:SART-1 family protein DOT2 [Pelomyxa schiedti]|nr:SART-1 family protein DOT2 [Pelomyxa schiedti]
MDNHKSHLDKSIFELVESEGHLLVHRPVSSPDFAWVETCFEGAGQRPPGGPPAAEGRDRAPPGPQNCKEFRSKLQEGQQVILTLADSPYFGMMMAIKIDPTGTCWKMYPSSLKHSYKDEPLVSSGVGATIRMLQRRDDPAPNIRLEHTDEFGRVLTPKEAFRRLSYKFHGKCPGKNKLDKALHKYQEELARKRSSSTDTPLASVDAMRRVQRASHQPHIVLSGPGMKDQLPLGVAIEAQDSAAADAAAAAASARAAGAGKKIFFVDWTMVKKSRIKPKPQSIHKPQPKWTNQSGLATCRFTPLACIKSIPGTPRLSDSR